jgi:hypothetical protein
MLVKGLSGPSLLYRVTALSTRSAWAVGTTAGNKPLIIHWNGSNWRRVKVPVKAGVLTAIAAVSGRDAWAVGVTSDSIDAGCTGVTPGALMPGLSDGVTARSISPLILHWNGRRWQQVKKPSLPAGSGLIGIAATSVRNAWAVGGAGGSLGAKAKALVLHWNGKRWQ